MEGSGSEAAKGLLLVILILLEFDEGGRVEPGVVVALIDFGSEEVGRALLFVRLFAGLLLLVLVI